MTLVRTQWTVGDGLLIPVCRGEATGRQPAETWTWAFFPHDVDHARGGALRGVEARPDGAAHRSAGDGHVPPLLALEAFQAL
jgi:hypothetical protein